MTAARPDVVSQENRFSFRVVPPARPVPSLAEDVRRGFARPQRELPPKYFYDEAGSQLFDRICDTPEYYPTRTEAELLREHAGEIIRQAAPEQLIEFGSGSCRKTRHLLQACAEQGFAPLFQPFEFCESMLRESAADLLRDYPWLRVNGLQGDYTAGLQTVPLPPGRRLFVFLGGTIGNFTPEQSRHFLTELRERMAPGDHLLLGADRVKAVEALEAAYDDAQGLTARFNLNVLRVLNRELGADFEPKAWAHQARFDPGHSRIEMHLRARSAQTVRVTALGEQYAFAVGESIRTEISRKFTVEALHQELEGAGLAPVGHFEPAQRSFSLLLARPA
ncbi:L-histidine N(alpha)-methyltransferase [Alkalilimnicola sp. S0819]|uniref:L-histidine N(alpha)-methyltransferase n=1 Tax=Alkalilimnicola sp. S0819 TaxID=2613922 RepID=UPI0012618FFE|nr:L-histidine N(alpha)-methyltransferase [Alkalilimnicola sp. S0819]KAB7623171.1 L-histidine N(alpha)-methyltransferase [Alkalilimnicola sp. S0819]MPQ17015.1 L-histidine N(alpha)-methyltransferase [Alkalilimnicola sp. S0819]